METGILALDIDGTVADASHHIPERVQHYLTGLAEKGWEMIFITGRTFPHGYEALAPLQFPYHFVVYNGAAAFKMPEKTVIRSHYLNPMLLPKLIELCRREGYDPMLHLGGDVPDCCYFRPRRFSEEMQGYFEVRQQATPEPWIAVESYDDLDLRGLCYAKVFGERLALERIAKEIEAVTIVVEDPYHPGFQILLVTHPLATKGAALKEFRNGRRVVAAGDDSNDLTMLEEADIAIAIDTAPEEVKAAADIIAPDIIAGLEQAL